MAKSLVVIIEVVEEKECVVPPALVKGDTVYFSFGFNAKKHYKSSAVLSNIWLK